MPRRKPRRILRSLLIAGLGLAALLGAAVVFVFPRVVEHLLLAELAAAGVDEAELAVRGVGWTSTRIADVRIGSDGELMIDEVGVAYAVPDLLAGRLRRVVVSGLRMRATANAGGLFLGALQPLLEPARTRPSGAPPISVASVELRDAELNLATPVGAVAVALSADIAVIDGRRVHGEGDVALRAAHGAAKGRLILDADADGRLEARFRIADGNLSLAPIQAKGLGGDVAMSGSGRAVERLDARFSAAELILPIAVFEDMTIDVAFAGNRLSAKAKARSSDQQIAITATGTVNDVTGPAPRFALEGEVAAAGPAALRHLLPSLQPVVGRGRAAVELSGVLPAPGQLATIVDPREALNALAVTGAVDLTLKGIAVPGLASGLSAAGRTTVELAAGVLTVTSEDGLWIGAAELEPAVLETLGLGALFRPFIEGRLALEIGGDGRTPPFLSARAEEDAFVVHTVADARLALSAGPAFDAELDVTAEVGADGAVRRFTVSELALAMDGLRLADTAIAVEALRLNLAGTPAAFGGGVSLHLAAEDATGPPLAVNDARLTVDGDVTFRDGRLTVTAPRGGTLRATGLRFQQLFEAAGPVEVSLDPSPGPALEVDFDGDNGVVLRHRVGLTLSALAGAAALSGQRRVAVMVEAPHLRLDGTARWPQGSYAGTVKVAVGRLRLPDYGVAFDGVDMTLHAGARRRPEGPLATFSVRALRQERRPAYVTPLRLDGEVDRADDRLAFSGRIGDVNGHLVVGLSGDHDLGRDRGRVAVKLHRLSFAPRVLQPKNLFPALRGAVSAVSGGIAAEGEIVWDGPELSTDLEVLIDDVSLRAGRLHLERVNSVVRIDRLWPPSTPRGQLVAVGLLDAGLPLADGIIAFRLAPEGVLNIESAEWHWAGGTIRTGELTVEPKAAHYDLELGVAEVDLAQIVELGDIDGLSATGRLSGRIPVAVTDDGVVIRDGRLDAASGGGILRYTPDDVPDALRQAGEAATLTLAALEDFRYERLQVTLDRKADGDTRIGFHLRGANPAFYEGHPVEFNLTVSGKLEHMLRRGLEGYRIPDAIRKRLQKFGS